MADSRVTPVDLGPAKVARRAEVPASAADIFELLADPRRHHEIDGSGTVQDVVSGPARLGPGEKFTVGMRMYGFPYRITSTVTAFEEGSVLEWRHPLGHRWRWELQGSTPEKTQPGKTQVTEVFDYSDSKLGKLFELLHFPEKNADGIAGTLTGLQRRFGG